MTDFPIQPSAVAAAADSRARPRVEESWTERLTRWRYTYWPDHVLGEILAKRWMETAIPVVVLILVALGLSREIPNFLSPTALSDTGRQAGETGFVVLGMVLVMIVGGIDLSVGSMFALTNFSALYVIDVLKWPVAAAVALTVAFGAALGAVNGVLIGYFRLRAFLTTLITLIIYRAVYDLLTSEYATAIAASTVDSDSWDFIGSGNWLGIPTVVYCFAAVAVFGHIFLTRLRLGWHVTAIGGSRRSAYNTGVAVRSTVAMCYVISGALTAIGGTFFASRLSTAGGDIGVGLEVTALTAAVLGGISLGGGKGSVTKAVVGTLIVLLITNGLTAMSLAGGYNRMALAAILVVAAVIDIRWLKNRHRIVNNVYVSPTYHALPPVPSTEPDCGTAWAQNDRLRPAIPIGLGRIEGPEDVILDRYDNLFTGSRHGDIVRFFPLTTSVWKSTRISAACRSAWRSTATTTSTSASAAWGFTVSPPLARSRRRPTRPTAASRRSTTTAGSASPTISTSPTTAASSSPRRPCATKCTNG